MKQYIIIGGGVASIGCIEGIRSIDKDGKIILLSKEKTPTYCRPLISYYLEGKTTLEKMKYRSDDFYNEQKCEVIFEPANSIDAENNCVLVGKKKLKYDSLCVATGSNPFVPPFEGLDTVPVKTSFMTIQDSLYLESVINDSSRVLIVGAGLIGLKCAEGIKDRVKSITVCDLADRVLSSILDNECASRIQNVLEDNGITFKLGNSVKKFEGNKAVLTDGTEVEFDVLVTAIGVRANTALVKDFVETDRGIIVDKYQRTTKQNIYSAGDCAQGYDASIDANRILAIFPNAYMQGYTAGVNMAGGEQTFDKGIPMNAIGFFGLHALTCGAYTGEMIETKDEKSIKRLFVKDGFLVGFILIGDYERAGILTSLVRNKTPLSDVNWEILKISPKISAFDKEKRKQILGGVI